VIVASAYRRDGKMYVGRRHCDVIRIMVDDFGLAIPIGVESDEDGFITSDGRFVDREEGYAIAKSSGQLKYHDPNWGECLYSESLW